MQVHNLATASVDTTAGGTFVLTAAEAALGLERGMVCVTVLPDVDIYLVNPLGTGASTPGTAANSPWLCPANVPTVISHRSGPLKAITASGTATVRRSYGCAP